MILIVDGDSDSGSSLQRMLNYRGMDAMAVTDGMEAIALLDMRTPRLILLDLEIADMNGLLFIRAVRRDPKFASTPIVVFTAVFADEVRRAVLREGAQDFIVKGTIGRESLMQRIEKLLECS
jgi:DNA-binding response OmpR family regulator